MWWTGPQWLSLNSSTWSIESKLPSVKDNLEERSSEILTVSKNEPKELWDLLHRYSNITKLLRITAICQRVILRFRKVSGSSLNYPLTRGDLEVAKGYWIKAVQRSSFHQEINILSQGQSLPSSNSLIRLTPFVDSSRFLLVEGRLQSALLPLNAKHPLILPKDSILTKLIVSDAHIRILHGGSQATLGFIRNDYWILGGRAPVRSFILKCVRCARYRQKRAQQLMGQLPYTRTTPSRPFLHSGIDYAGPLMLKTWEGRAARTYKAYIALFVCHSTSAVHLELVTDYTAEAFLAAYKRFSSRRGICVTLSSDCGTNLKGADFELQNLFCSASNKWKHLASLLANDGTQWKFNPPGAPNFGGKWEAGVKSVKHHLRRVIGEQTLTYEEMATLLTQIEAVLNSRPLCPLTDDPDDLTALTPGHFLIGNALAIIPEPSLEEIKTSRLSR
ncbi:uncharacterized protein LOC112494270 [Cephus cinctus]|uniref:Uncharacterized protein LOC112494270 n=1 Tax=Cephus cinctus TaxID=211228 RepID=A0AAJ7RGY2_CEPCN|nr:uncharacterized protein LOC112494270 [Cephus cinctus]XP_024940201.1 uncharacterized protein LOC112494270 [Cephus cinctus]